MTSAPIMAPMSAPGSIPPMVKPSCTVGAQRGGGADDGGYASSSGGGDVRYISSAGMQRHSMAAEHCAAGALVASRGPTFQNRYEPPCQRQPLGHLPAYCSVVGTSKLP